MKTTMMDHLFELIKIVIGMATVLGFALQGVKIWVKGEVDKSKEESVGAEKIKQMEALDLERERTHKEELRELERTLTKQFQEEIGSLRRQHENESRIQLEFRERSNEKFVGIYQQMKHA